MPAQILRNPWDNKWAGYLKMVFSLFQNVLEQLLGQILTIMANFVLRLLGAHSNTASVFPRFIAAIWNKMPEKKIRIIIKNPQPEEK